jgi:phage/plasmid-associated DNA primase
MSTYERIADDDLTAAKLFIDDIRDIVRKSNGQIFIRIGPIWKRNKYEVQEEMLAICLKANIVNSKGSPISANVPTARRIVMATKALLKPDNKFHDLIWRSNIGTICFGNGLYDFRLHKFFKYDERPDVYPILVVPRDFPTSRPSDELMSQVRQKLLLNTLGTDDVIDTYLRLIARAIAGEFTDKQWGVMIGGRNSGKGVLQGINESTWGPYVNTVTANTFLFQKYNNNDAAKSMSWAMDCEYCRLTYTNNVKCEKLDGNRIKDFQSGGDAMSARKNHKDERTFRIASKLIMNANAIPKVSPKDACSTMVLIKFPFEFVSPGDAPLEINVPFKVRDDTLKTEYCLRDDVIDAWTYLVIDAYKV